MRKVFHFWGFVATLLLASPAIAQAKIFRREEA